MTPQRRATFLQVLAETGIVIAAAQAAGPHQATCSTVTWRDLRAKDPEFAREWDEALEKAAAKVEAEARRRAIEGYSEPVYQKGEEVGKIVRYSDRLLELLLKAKCIGYADKTTLNVQGGIVHAHGTLAEVMSSLRGLAPESRDDLRRILEREAEGASQESPTTDKVS